MREVSIHSLAEREILAAMAWYEAEQQGISAAIIKEVIAATEQIVLFPHPVHSSDAASAERAFAGFRTI